MINRSKNKYSQCEYYDLNYKELDEAQQQMQQQQFDQEILEPYVNPNGTGTTLLCSEYIFSNEEFESTAVSEVIWNFCGCSPY